MKLINSINGSRYNTVDTVFISDYKWEFLADKYRITLNDEEWSELEEEYYRYKDGVADILYADVNGYSCLDTLQSAFNYKEIERLLKYRKIILYTNEDKDFHILVQCEILKK